MSGGTANQKITAPESPNPPIPQLPQHTSSSVPASKTSLPHTPGPFAAPLAPRGYKVLFLEDYHGSRSVCSETLVALYEILTRDHGGHWPVETVRSAGYLTANHGNCTSVVRGLGIGPVTIYGNITGAIPLAINAACDLKCFDHLKSSLTKTIVRSRAVARSPQGFTVDMFRTYDYIVAYTTLDVHNLARLRLELVARYGPLVVPGGKCKVVHLGRYMPLPGDIDRVQTCSREQLSFLWLSKILCLKTAIETFLQKELGWNSNGELDRLIGTRQYT